MAFPISRKGEGLKRALFLCEDNYLHGRFCEELFNSLVRAEGLNWQAVSRAMSPAAARRHIEPMSPAAVDFLRSVGAAPVNHRRLPLGATAFDFEMSFVAVAIAPRDREPGLDAAWPQYATQVEAWRLDAGVPVEERLRELAFAVGQLVDRMLDRGSARAVAAAAVASGASTPGASVKLGSQLSGSHELRHVPSRQTAFAARREPLRPG